MEPYKKIINTIKKHKKELSERYKIKEIGIFGSYVRGEEKKKSDVDILVEFEDVPDLFKFLEVERSLEGFLGLKVDLVRKKALKEELRNIILKEVINI